MPAHEQPVSVVMPVHNAMPHLDRAVQSILEQTHRNLEFVIFDDGSTDGSTARLREWAGKDNRIRLIESATNLGPVGSSHRVVDLASHGLIARMDADDVSLPSRLEKQLALLKERPDVGLVACSCDVIDAAGQEIRGPDRWRLTRKSWFAPFAHGSALFRRELFDSVGGYRDACSFWEDQDLFTRMLIHGEGKIVTVPEALYRVRYSRVSTRLASDQSRVEAAVDLMYRCVDRLSRAQLYEDMLDHTPIAHRLDPRVFIATGSLTLWAGGRPRLARSLLNNGDLRPNFRTLSALVWTLWASLSPASLRAFMKLLVAIRNSMAPRRRLRAPVEWLPPTLSKIRRHYRVLPRPVPKSVPTESNRLMQAASGGAS